MDLTPEQLEALRRALIEVAGEAYEDALIRGVCREGAWDVAMDALRAVKLDALIDRLPESE